MDNNKKKKKKRKKERQVAWKKHILSIQHRMLKSKGIKKNTNQH